MKIKRNKWPISYLVCVVLLVNAVVCLLALFGAAAGLFASAGADAETRQFLFMLLVFLSGSMITSLWFYSMLHITRTIEDNTNRTAILAEQTYHLFQNQQFNQKLTEPRTVQNRPSSSKLLPRTWKSNDGNFSIEAEFVSFDGSDVKLKNKNGKVVSFPFNRLSIADRELVRKTS